ncbi:HU family DNA-binding protein [Candidatus Pelagibacter bacterium]|nr:HU family DNA-binding protein [Candidatus Pelagibacter bacterium]
MSRQKLIKQLKNKNPKLNQSELENILNIFSKTLYNKLINGNSLEIRGFGRWYSKKLKENFNARNPSTNELIYKPERVKIRFKPSKKLNKIINE